MERAFNTMNVAGNTGVDSSAGSGNLVGYFGFGSLVNRHTLRTSYHDIVEATLLGWQRHWQARTDTMDEKVALLSIHRNANCQIKGMLVLDDVSNLAYVDEREAGYDRVEINAEALLLPVDFDPPEKLYVYVAREDADIKDDGALLQSYLDAVMQGFFQVYGESGVRHFVDTTSKFKRPIILDREAPQYPRSVKLSVQEADLFDTILQDAGVVF